MQFPFTAILTLAKMVWILQATTANMQYPQVSNQKN